MLTSSPWILGSVALGLAVLLALRPRLLLAPLVALFALWSGLKVFLAIPGLLRAWLEAAIVAKHAEGLRHHAEAAAALWNANTEFRPAAREVFGRVAAGYGIRPMHDVDDEQPPEKADFGAAARNAAAFAVNAAGGGASTKPKLAEAKAP